MRVSFVFALACALVLPSYGRADVAFQTGTESIQPDSPDLPDDLDMYKALVDALDKVSGKRVQIVNETPRGGAKAVFTPLSRGRGQIQYDSTPNPKKPYDVYIELVHELRHALDHAKGRLDLKTASQEEKVLAEMSAFAVQTAFVRILIKKKHKKKISDKYYTTQYDQKVGFTKKAFEKGEYMFGVISSYYRLYVDKDAEDEDIEAWLSGKADWIEAVVKAHDGTYKKYK